MLFVRYKRKGWWRRIEARKMDEKIPALEDQIKNVSDKLNIEKMNQRYYNKPILPDELLLEIGRYCNIDARLRLCKALGWQSSELTKKCSRSSVLDGTHLTRRRCRQFWWKTESGSWRCSIHLGSESWTTYIEGSSIYHCKEYNTIAC